ncbi:hypothetical protein D3C87_2066530 [compost metagenome]
MTPSQPIASAARNRRSEPCMTEKSPPLMFKYSLVRKKSGKLYLIPITLLHVAATFSATSVFRSFAAHCGMLYK